MESVEWLYSCSLSILSVRTDLIRQESVKEKISQRLEKKDIISQEAVWFHSQFVGIFLVLMVAYKWGCIKSNSCLQADISPSWS